MTEPSALGAAAGQRRKAGGLLHWLAALGRRGSRRNRWHFLRRLATGRH